MTQRQALIEYLNRYYRAAVKLEELERTSAILKGKAGSSSGGDLSRVSVKSSGVSDPTAAYAIRISQLDENIAMRRLLLPKYENEIIAVLNFLPVDSTGWSVLTQRFLEFKKHEEIYLTLFISRSVYFRIFNSAIDELLRFKKVQTILEA